MTADFGQRGRAAGLTGRRAESGAMERLAQTTQPGDGDLSSRGQLKRVLTEGAR